MIKEKIHNTQTMLREQRIEVLCIGNFGHQIHDDLLYYLLLCNIELCVLFIPQRGKPTLYAIPFEVAQFKKAYQDIIVKPFHKTLHDMLRRYPRTVGYRPSAFPTAQYKKACTVKKKKELIPFIGEEEVMAIKLPEEKKRVQQAGSITDVIFSNIVQHWHLFKTELDVSQYILEQCVVYDVEPSFPPIVASGKHASNPHHQSTRQPLKKGFCVIDMGVRYKGYCSDMTRTLYVGTPTKKERDLYTHLLDAQTKAVNACTPGTRIADIASACRKNLGSALNKYFTHSLGHGLGTQVHEWPGVSIRETTLLKESMVITIEPGVYIPHTYGIRIEDDVLITKKNPRVLTLASKKLCVV